MNREIKLVQKYDPNFLLLLTQVADTTREQAIQKVDSNTANLDRLLSYGGEQDLTVFFGLDGIAIGAIKYRASPVMIRKKEQDGVILLNIDPYLEIGSISVLPELQHQGKSKLFYNFFLDFIEKFDLVNLSRRLLIGGMVYLNNFIVIFMHAKDTANKVHLSQERSLETTGTCWNKLDLRQWALRFIVNGLDSQLGAQANLMGAQYT